jgi:hypothetical protein
VGLGNEVRNLEIDVLEAQRQQIRCADLKFFFPSAYFFSVILTARLGSTSFSPYYGVLEGDDSNRRPPPSVDASVSGQR